MAAKVSGITENHYAKVFGSVREDNGSKIVLIMKVCPVSDCNVITHHLLQFHYFIASAQVERNKQVPNLLVTYGSNLQFMEFDDV